MACRASAMAGGLDGALPNGGVHTADEGKGGRVNGVSMKKADEIDVGGRHQKARLHEFNWIVLTIASASLN